MDKGGGRLESIDFGRVFPFVHLFRALRIALDVRCLILGTVAVLLVSAGNRASENLPFASGTTRFKDETGWPWPAVGFTGDAGRLEVWNGPGDVLWGRPAELAAPVLLPLAGVLGPARVLFGIDTTWGDVAMAWTRLLWAFAVWAVVGGVITRVAAVKFARDERVATSALLRFTGGKFLSYLAAPLLPLAAIGLFRAIGLFGGLVALIPHVGEILIGVFWILALVLGLILSLIVIGGVAGWPLMYATISVENSDAFDGFSRSYSYVYSRPWQYAWYAIVAMAYGAALMVLVSALADFVVYLSGWSMATVLSGERLGRLYESAPEVFRSTSDSRTTGPQETYPLVAADLVSFWLHVVAGLLAGFGVSYFWTATTIMYFLLRRSDDATEFDHIQIPDGEEKDELLPLVGVAASEQAVIERPPGRIKPAEETEPAPD